MAAGMQVWNAAGDLIIDLTTSLPRLLGIISVSGTSGSHSDADLARGEPWFFVIGQSDPFLRPNISFTGTTLNWAVPTGVGSFSGDILYGVR